MKNISLITYNCHLNVPFNLYHEEERRDGIISELRSLNADIVALCEVWGDWKYANRILDGLSDLYHFHIFDDGSILSLGHGLLILSKFPLYNNYVCSYKDSADWDKYASKSFLHTCIHAGESLDFRLFFTHTQADSKHKGIRERQFVQILEKMNTYYADTPALLAGDLNVDPDVDQAEYIGLCKLFGAYSDLYKFLNEKEKGYTYDTVDNELAKKWGGENIRQRLDYIFFSKKNWQINQNPENISILKWGYSDHYPLFCKNLILSQSSSIQSDNVFDKEKDAKAETDREKEKYGNGVSVKLLISNNSDIPLSHWGDWIWDGSFQKNPPTNIGNKQWAGIFFHHPDGEAVGCKGGMVYEIGGTELIVFLGYRAPYVYKNRCFVKIIKKNEWNKDIMSNDLDNGEYSSEHSAYGYKVTGNMTTGTTPYCTFIVQHVFDAKV